jgi:hypothetical protein
VCIFFAGKCEGKRQLGRNVQCGDSIIKMDLSEIEWEGVDRINLAQDKRNWQTIL